MYIYKSTFVFFAILMFFTIHSTSIVYADSVVASEVKITSFTPSSGQAGSHVVIFGTGFNSVDAVVFLSNEGDKVYEVNKMRGGNDWATPQLPANIPAGKYRIALRTKDSVLINTPGQFTVQNNASFTNEKSEIVIVNNVDNVVVAISPNREALLKQQISLLLQLIKLLQAQLAAQVQFVTSLTPQSGIIGTRVTVYGTNVNTNNEYVLFNGYRIATDGTKVANQVSFYVPEYLAHTCVQLRPTDPCPPVAVEMVIPGLYSVAVVNAKGVSNSLKFTVTSGLTIAPNIDSLKR